MEVQNDRYLPLLMIFVAAVAGCGPRPVAGGTPGSLRAAGKPLGEVEVTVHKLEGGKWQAIGFGDVHSDGSFELVTTGARGPLALSPGEYRCTLESIGAPIVIPADYAHVGLTPLKATWTAADSRLELSIAVPRTP
jgi:hypothetical protein